jgi:hypothetical protein
MRGNEGASGGAKKELEPEAGGGGGDPLPHVGISSEQSVAGCSYSIRVSPLTA